MRRVLLQDATSTGLQIAEVFVRSALQIEAANAKLMKRLAPRIHCVLCLLPSSNSNNTSLVSVLGAAALRRLQEE